MAIYSIGHSNVSIEQFVDLLRRTGIDVLIDARSAPYSRYNPQFNRESLQKSATEAGIRYAWLGDRIGGKPADPTLRSADGGVDYDLVMESRPFNDGLDQVIEMGATANAAVMCAEADFRRCHRYWLITRALAQRGLEVLHILHSGELAATDHEDFSPRQGRLF